MASVTLRSGRIGLLQLPQTGRGRPEEIVMVHGLGANCGFWYASAVQWFRRFGRVTLFDLPGHGESDMPGTGYSPARLARVVGELLDHLQIDRVHLVAHSFGGVVALAFASRHPQRVKSLVLADVRVWAIEPPSSSVPSTPWLHRVREAGLNLTESRLDVGVQVLVELARLRLEQNQTEAAEFDVLPGARSLFRGRRAARKWLQLIRTTQAYDEMTDPDGLALADLARVQQPMLAAYGELSPRKRTALALQQLCPRCELQPIANAGHFFPLTRPAAFARPALAFLRSISRGETVGTRQRRLLTIAASMAELPVAEAAQ